MEALAAHHALYALDLPGHGDSDKLTIDYDIAPGIKVFRRFLERIGEPRVALIGNSSGGLIALRFALEYPDQVTHLVLVDSVGLGKEVSWALRLAAVPPVGEVLLHRALVSVKGLGRRLFKVPQRIDPGLLRALHRARTIQLASGVMLAMARSGMGVMGVKKHTYLLPRLGELKAPLLVVWGEDDKVMPVKHAWEVARRYPHTPVKVFPDTSHWPHMERADEFNELVLRFLWAEIPATTRA